MDLMVEVDRRGRVKRARIILNLTEIELGQ